MVKFCYPRIANYYGPALLSPDRDRMGRKL